MRRTLCLTLLLLLPAVSASAHNGEYVPPEKGRRPPGSRPGGPAIGTPGKAPTTRSQPGVPTPRGTEDRPGPVTAGSVERSPSISWETAWELVRRWWPEGPPPPEPEQVSRAVAALRAALADEDERVRERAALALGRIGDLAGLAAVREHPGSGLELLGPGLAAWRLGTPEAGDGARALVLPVLKDASADPFRRAMAAISTGLAGPKGAGVLVAALGTTDDPGLKTAILYALGLTGHPGGADLVLDEVLSPGDDARRALLTSTLRKSEDLVRRLGDGSDRVRAAAALGLGKHPALAPLVAAGSDRAASAALLSLAMAADPKAPELAKEILADPVRGRSDLGALAAFSLGLCGRPEDGPALVSIYADTRLPAEVRAAAGVAVGLARGRDIREPLRKAALAEKNSRVRAFGLTGLALLAREAAAPLLLKELGREKSEEVRRLLTVALGFTGGAKAADALEEGLGDTYRVNREAALSLWRIDRERALGAVLVRLAEAKNRHARRYAAIVLGRMLDRRGPSFYESALLRAGADAATPLERLLLYLKSEVLLSRLPPLR